MGFYFCGFPHGVMSVYAMILGISCTLLCISSSWGCYYAIVDFTLDRATATVNEDGRMGVGLFSFEDKSLPSYTCRAYTDVQIESFGGTFAAAHAFAIIANVILGLSMIFFILLSCVGVPTIIIKAVAVCLFLGGICEFLTFMFFGAEVCSDYDCDFSFGAGLAIICGIVTLINSCVAMNIPPEGHDIEVDIFGPTGPRLMVVERPTIYYRDSPSNASGPVRSAATSTDPGEAPPSTPVSPQVVPPDRVEEKQFSDGTKQIIKTIYNKDGTRTVEETTIGV